jgi:uncharacterized protein (TIGR00290 family)
MKFVALVSGGKDSTFAVSEAIQQGHELVGLAHLGSFSLSDCLSTNAASKSRFSVPGTSVERDSWMYQSVGSELVPYLALAFDKPMFWIEPASGDDYNKEEDEYLESFGASAFRDANGRVDRDVVRLWRLLRAAKQNLAIYAPTALVSGAILSNYQRTRIEVVCRALGWVSISPLWQRDQSSLLSQMGSSAAIDARLIKTASIGLTSSHLMQSLCPSKPKPEDLSHTAHTSPLGAQLKKLSKQYGVNECGEGGEYESFSLDAGVFPNFRILPLSWSVVSSDDSKSIKASSSDASEAHVSHIRFTKLALVEKHENAISSVSGHLGPASSGLSTIVIPFSESSNWTIDENGTRFEESVIQALEQNPVSSPTTLSDLLKILILGGRMIIIESKFQNFGALPIEKLDTTRPISRNPLIASDPAIDQLKVTGPHFRTAGGLVGEKLGIKPSTSSSWTHSNFYIECSHHVYEDCRSSAQNKEGLHAKNISQATQAVMNAIGRTLKEKGLSFKDLYFASLTIPSMSVFGDMNPVYSSYFVPIHNPPSRVTVAQKPRHSSPAAAAAAASASSIIPDCNPSSVDPSIRIEFWGIIPSHIDEALVGSLALSQNIFFAHNVLHVESYSGWAPACIGPYSQAHEVYGVDHLAGQIALIPTEMVLFAPSPSSNTDPETLLLARTLGELKWALKHVVSLVTARSYKQGNLNRPSELLFSSMFTSVPVAMANTCIDMIKEKGTLEEIDALEYVLKGATLLRVDELPRMAAVEIQVVMDSPESVLYSSTDSNLVPYHGKSGEYADAKKSNVFRKDVNAASGHGIYTRYNISQSLGYAHTQHLIVGPKTTQMVDAAAVVASAKFVLNIIAPFIACRPETPPSHSLDTIPPSLLSSNLYFKSFDKDNSTFFELARSSDPANFHFTPYPVVELGAPNAWVQQLEPGIEVLAVLHTKWALAIDLDD